MDWESKFSSIVRETESNLAKVKQKLGSARACASLTYSSPLPGHDTALTHFSSTNPLPGVTEHHGDTNDAIIPLEQSPGVIAIMQERLETQNQTIDRLIKSVKQLEDERDLYVKQMRGIREELALLSSRERHPEANVERKLDQMRRDFRNEMHLVQSSLQLQKTKDQDYSPSSTSMTVMAQDLQDLRRLIIDEQDNNRRDVESLKSRIVKLECDLATCISDNRDFSRKHERVERMFKDSMNFTSRERIAEREDKSEFRSSVHNLQEKMTALEGQFKDLSFKSKSKAKRSPSFTIEDWTASDLDLSSTCSLEDLELNDSVNDLGHDSDFGDEKDKLDDLDLDLSSGSEAPSLNFE